MTATQAATKASTPDTPLASAQAEQEVAESDVKRLTLAIADLRQRGPGADPVLLARLQDERESASKLLRRIDLEAAEQTAAATGPLSPKVLEKIRLRRRRVEDLHAAVLGRMGESQRLREHLGGLRNSIAQLRASWEFRREQQELRSAYVFPHDLEDRDNPPPARGGQKTPQSTAKLALLERDLETTAAELRIAVAAQEAASQRWQAEKAVLDGWESAIRRLGPAARAALDAMPQPGAATMGLSPGEGDFRNGIVGHAVQMIR